MFTIFNQIAKNVYGFGDEQIDDQKLIDFIEKNGVDYKISGEKLLYYWDYFSKDQIDLIMSYKPNFYDANGDLMYVGCTSEKALYMLQKMVEYDHNYVLCTHTFAPDPFSGMWENERLTYIEYIRNVFVNQHDLSTQYTGMIIDLLESHDRKRKSFFEIMWDKLCNK